MTTAFNPSGSSAIAADVDWIQGVLLGSVATTMAVIAVATIGILMLSGRINVRRAAEVVLGCFIIFGASTIASGIFGTASAGGADADFSALPVQPPDLPQPTQASKAASTPYDPYAGAALPSR